MDCQCRGILAGALYCLHASHMVRNGGHSSARRGETPMQEKAPALVVGLVILLQRDVQELFGHPEEAQRVRQAA